MAFVLVETIQETKPQAHSDPANPPRLDPTVILETTA